MRGFSLFTPLVGTTVIMIAIVVSASMVQNDVRISRGITASYEVASQSIASKIIKAAIDVKIIENTEFVLDNIMNNQYSNPAISVTCSNKNSCLLAMERKFTSTDGTLVRELSSGGHGIYSGVINSIETVTNYKSTSGNENGIFTFLANNPSAIKAEFVNGRLNIRLNPTVLTQRNDLFSVSFQNNANKYDRITINIIPYGFTYVSKDSIDDMLTKSAVAFESASGSCPPRPVGSTTIRKYGSSTSRALEVDWPTSSGKFTVLMQTDANAHSLNTGQVC